MPLYFLKDYAHNQLHQTFYPFYSSLTWETVLLPIWGYRWLHLRVAMVTIITEISPGLPPFLPICSSVWALRALLSTLWSSFSASSSITWPQMSSSSSTLARPNSIGAVINHTQKRLILISQWLKIQIFLLIWSTVRKKIQTRAIQLPRSRLGCLYLLVWWLNIAKSIALHFYILNQFLLKFIDLWPQWLLEILASQLNSYLFYQWTLLTEIYHYWLIIAFLTLHPYSLVEISVHSFISFQPNYTSIVYFRVKSWLKKCHIQPKFRLWPENCISSRRLMTFDLELWPFTSIVSWEYLFYSCQSFLNPTKFNCHRTFQPYGWKMLFLAEVQWPLTSGKFIQNVLGSSTPHVVSLGQVWTKSIKGFAFNRVYEIWGVLTDGQTIWKRCLRHSSGQRHKHVTMICFVLCCQQKSSSFVMSALNVVEFWWK